MIIYHNPRCKKSRETLELIREQGIEPEIVEYLKEPPTPEELRSILDKLGMKAEGILRKNERTFKEQFKGQELSEAEWLKALNEHPKMIERPIVVEGDRAVLGRPPENVKELF